MCWKKFMTGTAAVLLTAAAVAADAPWRVRIGWSAKDLAIYGVEPVGRTILERRSDGALAAGQPVAPEKSGCFYTYAVTLPKPVPGEKRILGLTVAAENVDFSGKVEAAILCDSSKGLLFLPGKLILNFKAVSQKYWELPENVTNARVYFFTPEKSTGTFLIRSIALEALPFDEEKLIDPLPPEGRVLQTDDFSNGSTCGWSVADYGGEHTRISNENDALKVELGGVQKLGKLVMARGVILPELPRGSRVRLQVSARVRAVNFSARGFRLRPLMTSRTGALSYPSPPGELPISEDWQRVVFDWDCEQMRSAMVHVMADGAARGTYYLDDVELRLIPIPAHAVLTGTEANIVNAASGVATVKPHNPASLVAGSVVMSDESGRELDRFELKPGVESYEVPLKNPGFYRFVISARYRDGSVVEDNVTASVSGPLLDEAIRKKSRFGSVAVSAGRKLAAEAGGRWDWWFTAISTAKLDENGRVLPAPIWKFPADDLLQTIMTVGSPFPLWLKPAHSGREKSNVYQPADWEKYRELIVRMAETKDFPEYFNVYNEPEGQWSDSWEEYVRWHKITREAIRSVHPDTQVLGPGHCNIDMALLKKLGGLGFYDVVDGVCVHPYVNATAPEGEFIKRIYDLMEYLESIGKRDLPVFFTEFGWSTGEGGSWVKGIDEYLQACYVTRALALAATTRVTGMTYFALYYHSNSPGEKGFSMIYPEYRPKPSYASYAAVCRNLGEFTEAGKWLRLSPETHLALFRRTPGSMTVLAWNTEKTVPFQAPFPVDRAATMTNAPLELPPNGVFTLSPAPVYWWTKDDSLFDYLRDEPIEALAGDRVPLDGGDVIAAPPLRIAAESVEIPAGTPAGTYTVLGKKDGQWRARELRVEEALKILAHEIRWEKASPLTVMVTAKSNWRTPVSAVAKAVTAEGTTYTSTPVTIPARGSVTFAIPAAPATNLGKATAALRIVADSAEIAASQEAEANLGIIECAKVPGPKIDWTKIAAVAPGNFFAFGMPENEAGIAPEDCSAALQTAWTDEALHLRVTVRDNEHLCQGAPGDMWRYDSLQLGFDVDADKPWSPNLQFGWNGHRIFEYGVGAGSPGKTFNWRWIAHDPKLGSQTSDDRVRTEFTRNGDKSVYEITIPFAALGLDRAPEPDTSFGFALLVNDTDEKPFATAGKEAKIGSGVRHGVGLFGGINDNKDFRKYGKIWFR